MRSYFPISEKGIAVPLFRRDGNSGKVDFKGSGALLTYGNRHFLGTAAHVLDRTGQDILILGGCKTAIELDRPFQLNQLQPGIRSVNDPIDFAVTELTDGEAKLLTERCRFISLDPDTPYRPLLNRLRLQITGFLGEDNSADNQNAKITANVLRLQLATDYRPLAHDLYRKKNRHWYLSGYYDPQRADFEDKKCVERPTDFGGLSGGAIFHEEPFLPGVFREFAGVTLECRQYKNGRLFTGIGTRAIIDILHKWYPGLPPPRDPPRNPLTPFSAI